MSFGSLAVSGVLDLGVLDLGVLDLGVLDLGVLDLGSLMFINVAKGLCCVREVSLE